ncbi:MAG: hypothetical protein ACJ746_17430 [Bryobacteraceae bacterium]
MKRMVPLAMLMAASALLASDPNLGTWKLNMAQSKFSPGPAPQSVTTTYTEDGGWVVSKSEGLGSDGKPFNVENRLKTDGNEYPYLSPWGKGTIVIQQANPYHWTSVVKLDSGHTLTSKGVISQDGRTRTVTTTGTNAKGEKVNSVTVSERQ